MFRRPYESQREDDFSFLFLFYVFASVSANEAKDWDIHDVVVVFMFVGRLFNNKKREASAKSNASRRNEMKLAKWMRSKWKNFSSSPGARTRVCEFACACGCADRRRWARHVREWARSERTKIRVRCYRPCFRCDKNKYKKFIFIWCSEDCGDIANDDAESFLSFGQFMLGRPVSQRLSAFSNRNGTNFGTNDDRVPFSIQYPRTPRRRREQSRRAEICKKNTKIVTDSLIWAFGSLPQGNFFPYPIFLVLILPFYHWLQVKDWRDSHTDKYADDHWERYALLAHRLPKTYTRTRTHPRNLTRSENTASALKREQPTKEKKERSSYYSIFIMIWSFIHVTTRCWILKWIILCSLEIKCKP